ncbi:sugar ABC transporter permease YjfF [Paenibacillus polysaccharolyticus]|uniref:galactofuranose ABC transporter, permease protein YjfF n=1 Tax=Paenibacillus TaxID=44249 RepID=UPI0012B72EE9|nr:MULTISPECIES: galactofuranose ABC transporter, permease protein YjfF [Paenibacillus]MCM3132168.1 sugar ABC transporter permease YjfF [Paenibacillus polysaccharolyticus]MCP1134415.1 sugar ABC transporter permease YjfF [Paenibacillus polysaccharolyticus]MDP9698293.1 simple sugar transport system permease protein [Paenibacillus intestini]
MYLNRKLLPVLVTFGLLAVMIAIGSFRYTGFFSTQVLFNLLIDNAFLIVTAIGMTFVIVSGGIDLSVGSVIALTTIISASLVEKQGWSPTVVIPMVLIMGAVFGTLMGAIIHYFKIQPFIVTLAGMFLARGLCYVISTDTITITNSFYTDVAQAKIPLPGGSFVSVNVIIALIVLLLAIFLAHYTRFGRNVYAIGGSEQSAMLMGLPVARTKILVYTFSGFCSALAGVVFTFYMLSGYGLHAMGLELDTIAAVVIGGTLLTGGVGYVAGTFLGVLIQGVIQTIISFEGTLSSWWTKIVIGLMLFVFILFQRLLSERRVSAKSLH